MSSLTLGHTYLFEPGRWDGKGKFNIIGHPSVPITLQMIISHSGDGTITARLEVNFEIASRFGGVELVYTIDLLEEGNFKFVQYHSQLGTLKGAGNTTAESISLNYKSDDGTYGGVESLRKISSGNYRLHSTLSLNGMPASTLCAAFRRNEDLN